MRLAEPIAPQDDSLRATGCPRLKALGSPRNDGGLQARTRGARWVSLPRSMWMYWRRGAALIFLSVAPGAMRCRLVSRTISASSPAFRTAALPRKPLSNPSARSRGNVSRLSARQFPPMKWTDAAHHDLNVAAGHAARAVPIARQATPAVPHPASRNAREPASQPSQGRLL